MVAEAHGVGPFPSAAQALAFYESDEYQKVLAISKQSARRTVVILDGI